MPSIISVISGKDADMARMLARDQLLLYASDDVIKVYDAWVRYVDIEKHDLDEEGGLVSLISSLSVKTYWARPE